MEGNSGGDGQPVSVARACICSCSTSAKASPDARRPLARRQANELELPMRRARAIRARNVSRRPGPRCAGGVVLRAKGCGFLERRRWS